MCTATVLPVAIATVGVPTRERLERLEALDLLPMRQKLQQPFPEGRGWTEEQALEAEKWYKRYLAAIIQRPETAKHVPNGPIDAFWHAHILDTMRYGPDCEHVLGYFLHHYPYYGLNGDEAERDNSFDDTNVIYRELFGEDCTRMAAFARHQPSMQAGVSCNSSGSGTGCSQGCCRGG